MRLECSACMHHCRLEPGQKGRCGARANENGRILCLNYGKLTALALDPIEKKPLRNFFPGSFILSAGSYGCNLKCPFCQNYQIAHPGGFGQTAKSLQTAEVSPEELAEKALELKPAGNIGIAFTYNEPLVGFEFVRDTSQLAHRKGLKTVAVTNGSFTSETARQVLPHLDALNIDLKGFTEEYYQNLGGNLQTVKEFIAIASEWCHVEVTTLIVPGENDSDEEMERLSGWVASVNSEIPLHITRFFPCWNMQDRDPAPVARIYELAETAGKRLSNVFTGNC